MGKNLQKFDCCLYSALPRVHQTFPATPTPIKTSILSLNRSKNPCPKQQMIRICKNENGIFFTHEIERLITNLQQFRQLTHACRSPRRFPAPQVGRRRSACSTPPCCRCTVVRSGARVRAAKGRERCGRSVCRARLGECCWRRCCSSLADAEARRQGSGVLESSVWWLHVRRRRRTTGGAGCVAGEGKGRILFSRLGIRNSREVRRRRPDGETDWNKSLIKVTEANALCSVRVFLQRIHFRYIGSIQIANLLWFYISSSI